MPGRAPGGSRSASTEPGEGAVPGGSWQLCSDSQQCWQRQGAAGSLRVGDCALSSAAPYLPLAWSRAVRATAVLRENFLKPATGSLGFLGTQLWPPQLSMIKTTLTKTIFNKKNLFHTSIQISTGHFSSWNDSAFLAGVTKV